MTLNLPFAPKARLRPVGEAEGKQFWGVDQDVESVGDFIRRYVTENGRWGSPKYVLGESYGGVRGAGLAKHLQSTAGDSRQISRSNLQNKSLQT